MGAGQGSERGGEGVGSAEGKMLEQPGKWVGLLEKEGIRFSEGMGESLLRFTDLVRRANRVCSLVSRGDLGELEEKHVVDSISLASIIARACGASGVLLDIGSGGGFPAIPVKVVLPTLRVVLVERSERKAGFLQRVVRSLGLEQVEVRCGRFPEAAKGLSPRVITARAVEQPAKVLRDILVVLPPGSVFLCQSSVSELIAPDLFHVERVRDAWSESGLRRGPLYLVRRLG